MKETLNYYVIHNSVSSDLHEVPATGSIFDDDGTLGFNPVPGHEGERYARWGSDDQMPYVIAKLAGDNEVLSQMNLFNALTCYGAGIHFIDKETKEDTSDADVEDWTSHNFLPSLFLNLCVDMKHYFWCAVVFILSRDGKRINRIVHKDACYCRLEEADAEGRIRYLYYANFRNNAPKKVERIPLLDKDDPLTDLRNRMEKGTELREKDCKVAMIMRFPTVGCQYYPSACWTSVFRGGSYEQYQLMFRLKNSKLRNFASVKYQVEIHTDYYRQICEDENITDPEKMKERILEERRHIRDFVSDIDNADKVWISGYYIDESGHEVHDVIIKKIDSEKAGGEWTDDIAAATNTMSFAGNCHPSLIGATPGKAQMNNSGSDKREMFTMKQALEIAFHDIMLHPLQLVCLYNGWTGVKPVVPMIQLTTLDEHKDARTVSSNA